MHILITGGAGYIGSHTAVELLTRGHDITIVDSLVNSKPEALRRIAELAGRAPEFHQVDLLDRRALEAVMALRRVDAVVHFAGLKAVGDRKSTRLNSSHSSPSRMPSSA